MIGHKKTSSTPLTIGRWCVACKISRYTNCLSKAFRKSIKWRHNTKIAPDVCFPVLHVYFLLRVFGTDFDKILYWEFVINLVEWILFRIYRILNVKDIVPGMRGPVVLYKFTACRRNIQLPSSGHTTTEEIRFPEKSVIFWLHVVIFQKPLSSVPQILNLLYMDLKYNGMDFLKMAHFIGYHYDIQHVTIYLWYDMIWYIC